MKINILLCDTFDGLLPADIPSYFSMFEKMFNSVRSNIEYQIYDVWNDKLPKGIKKGDVFLITGSTAGAYDELKWVKSLLGFIREAYAKECKLIGICFGHQAIALALGGEVKKTEIGWGIGIRESLIVENSALHYFENGSMRLLYNHHDQVTRIPIKATLFATSEFSPNEGFFIGRQVLTFQGHPEFTIDYNKYLILEHAENESDLTKELALKSMENSSIDNLKVSKWLIDFIDE